MIAFGLVTRPHGFCFYVEIIYVWVEKILNLYLFNVFLYNFDMW